MYNKKHCKLFAKQRLILQMEELMKIVYRWGTKCRFFKNKVAVFLAKTNKSDRPSHCFRLPEDPLESLWTFFHRKFVLSIHKCIVHSYTVAAAEEVEGSQEYIRENWIFGFWNSVECFWKLWKFISWMLLLQKVICELNRILINLLSLDLNTNNTMKLRIPVF